MPTRKRKLTPEDAFGRVIRERRLALGLTQADLEGVDGDGLERSYISRLEAGRYQVCLRGILHLANVLQMTASELMKEVEARLGGVILPRQMQEKPATSKSIATLKGKSGNGRKKPK